MDIENYDWKDFEKIEYPRDGQLVTILWSDGTETNGEWRFNMIDWQAGIVPVLWREI